MMEVVDEEEEEEEEEEEVSPRVHDTVVVVTFGYLFIIYCL